MTNVVFYSPTDTVPIRSRGGRVTARGAGPEHTGVRAEVQQQQREILGIHTSRSYVYQQTTRAAGRRVLRPCATWFRGIGEISSVVRVCTSLPPRPPGASVVRVKVNRSIEVNSPLTDPH